MQEENTLILEIIRQADMLKMSLVEAKHSSSTLKQYSQHKVDFIEIEKLCHEITLDLSKISSHDLGQIKILQKAGQALWDHLLSRPVKEKLKGSYYANLILAIEEELISIPWELLYDGDNFLCLNFNLGRLVRTKTQAPPGQYRSLAHTYRMLILANPTNDLKRAYQEGLSIRNQFEHKLSSIRVDFKSTNVDKLYVKKNLSDYDIIHFAGHCEYDPHNFKNSGWVLSDGRFTIHDILNMGQAASLPSLVFSNACYSAFEADVFAEVDYQKKSYSLAAAFLFSGVRHYIGSIRKIEDAASLIFAREFYHCLILGKSVGECLRLARLKLVKEQGLTSLHWANYLLYGDPSFILIKPKLKTPKPRKSLGIKIRKKLLVWGLSLVIPFIIGTLLYIWLPTINPGAYYLYLKSRKDFIKGDNQKVIQLADKIIKKDPRFADIYLLLADTYQRLGDKKHALKYYFDYTLLVEKRHDLKRLANGYIEIGWLYQLEGEYSKAFDFYHKALNLARNHNDRLNEAIALRKLAVWHIDKREYGLALEMLTKSSEINRERQHLFKYRYNLACDYFDLGLVFANKDDYKAAEEFYRKSRLLFEKLNLKGELSDYYFNLGELNLCEKQYQKALDYYLTGLKIDLMRGNKLNLVSDYNMLGELYLEMDKTPEAKSAFDQAIVLAQEIQFRPELAVAYRNLGLLYKKLGNKNKSREYLRLAQEIYSSIDPLAYQEVKSEILSLDASLD